MPLLTRVQDDMGEELVSVLTLGRVLFTGPQALEALVRAGNFTVNETGAIQNF